MNGQNLTKFCVHVIIDKIYIGLDSDIFSQIWNRVSSEFVFAPYLERTKFNQIFIYTLSLTRSMLGLLRVFKQSYAPEYIFVLG